MRFTKILNKLIQEKNITITEVSKSTGIAKSTLHNLMNGTEPSLSKAQKLAEYFNVSLDYLVLGKECQKSLIEELIKSNSFEDTFEVIIRKTANKKRKY